MRGISLEEIAQHTKISTRMLEAIENDRFDLLPSGIFSRAFVMHYARYLGLNEEGAGAEFDLAVGTPEPVRIEEVAAQREHQGKRSAAAGGPAAERRRRLRLFLGLAAVLVLSAVALRDYWGPVLAGYRAPAVSPPAPLPAPPAPRVLTEAPAPAPSTGATPATPAAPSAGSGVQPSPAAPAGPPGQSSAPAAMPLQLQIDTIDTSTLVVIADGKTVFRGAMRKGQMRRVAADARVEVRASNAGVVVLTLNGETQPPLGRMGEAKTAVFTREDLKKP